MNELTLTTTASQINHEHSLALKHANEAIGQRKTLAKLRKAA